MEFYPKEKYLVTQIQKRKCLEDIVSARMQMHKFEDKSEFTEFSGRNGNILLSRVLDIIETLTNKFPL